MIVVGMENATSEIHSTAVIHPDAKIGKNVIIGPGAVIGEHVEIGDGTKIGANVVIGGWTTIGKNNEFFPGCAIGLEPQDLKFKGEKTRTVIGNNNKIREFVTIHRGTDDKYETRIGNNCLIMAYVHIAHDCIIGDNCVLANAATFAGHVEVEDYAVVGGLTAIHQFTRVGRHAMIGGCSAVTQDVVPYMLSEGNKARAVYINIVGLQRRGFSEEQIKTLREVYKIIFKKKLKLEEALQILEKEYSHFDEAMKVVEFIRKSKRGITR